jgi:hypothetical protein
MSKFLNIDRSWELLNKSLPNVLNYTKSMSFLIKAHGENTLYFVAYSQVRGTLCFDSPLILLLLREILLDVLGLAELQVVIPRLLSNQHLLFLGLARMILDDLYVSIRNWLFQIKSNVGVVGVKDVLALVDLCDSDNAIEPVEIVCRVLLKVLLRPVVESFVPQIKNCYPV